jgi:hypothetical protein
MKVTELITLLQDAPEHAQVYIRVLEHELAEVTKVVIERRDESRMMTEAGRARARAEGKVVLSTGQPLDLITDHSKALRGEAPTPYAVARMQQRMGWLRD